MPSVTLLTGASSGIGRALAPLVAGEGHSLALVARRAEPLAQLAAELRAGGTCVLELVADVGDRAAMHEVVRRCEAELGPIDRLIANAGIAEQTPAVGFDATVVEAIFRTNFFGACYLIESVLPGMLARGRGHLVGISSLGAWRGWSRFGAYSGSKAALWMMLESLRAELRPRGVQVTSILPGFIRTPMTDKNRFSMPLIMDVDRAAARIHRAIVRGKSTYAFPWLFAALFGQIRAMPDAWFDRLASRHTLVD